MFVPAGSEKLDPASPASRARCKNARTAEQESGMGRVAGKVALVAGAGGGIGGAGAEALERFLI